MIVGRGLLLVFLAGLVAAVSAGPPPRVAIIIDDLGNNLELGRGAIALPGALTYAVLPQRPYSALLADEVNATGREVMLHLPMQAGDGRRLGPGGLCLDLAREDFARRVHESVASVPHVVGVNNHMGSLLTREPLAMEWLMADLACIGGLYFVDSRTDVRTVAREAARAAGLANAQRDVFLDHLIDTHEIRRQFQRLIDRAHRQGTAIAIGHPHPQTLTVLAELLPTLPQLGVSLVPVSQLVSDQRSEPLWHACSYPSPKVAKNSRP
jgi:polysaccharide deacetylase 2 family uncharacterized protein YibQ